MVDNYYEDRHRQHSSGITALVTPGVDTQKRRTPVVKIAGISASLEFVDIRGPVAIEVTVRIVEIWIKSVRDFPRIRHSVAVAVATIISGAKFVFFPGSETVSVGIDIAGGAGTEKRLRAC